MKRDITEKVKTGTVLPGMIPVVEYVELHGKTMTDASAVNEKIVNPASEER